MTYDEMIAAILGAKNDMETKPVPLTPGQIFTLRDALNLAAEYTAKIDDPTDYTEWDRQRIAMEIERFRQLNDYLQQFEVSQ